VKERELGRRKFRRVDPLAFIIWNQTHFGFILHIRNPAFALHRRDSAYSLSTIAQRRIPFRSDPQCFKSLQRAFRELFREARQKADLKQHEVAKRLGKPRSSLPESGERRVDVIEFIAICGAISAMLSSCRKD
jgi:DNA-binding XRE family transcriptional regulator